MKKLFFFYFTILFILFSCSKGSTENPEPNSENPNQEEPKEEIPEEEEEKKNYFTLKVNDDTFPNEDENWIVIHDLDGNIMDYGNIVNSSIYNFDKNISDLQNEYNISLINIFGDNGNKHHHINTYTHIDQGASWTLYNSNSTEGAHYSTGIGQLYINANNLDSPITYNLSNKYGSIPYYPNSSTTGELINYHSTTNLYEENRYLFSMYDTNGNGTYIFLENLYDGQTINFDGNEMLPFDKTVPVSLPEDGTFFSLVFGFMEDQPFRIQGGYVLNTFSPSDSENLTSNVINLGYLNSLNKYRTIFNYDKDKFHFGYQKFGDIPSAINIGSVEDWSMKVIDDSIYNFIYTGPSPNTYSQSRFSWESIQGTRDIDYSATVWNILQGKYNYSYKGQLPTEIIDAYPDLDTQNLNYVGVSFYVNEYSYLDFINSKFVEPNPELTRNHEYFYIEN